MIRIVIVASLGLLTGCVNAETRYTNPTTTGQMVSCNTVAFGVISSIVAETQYQKCKSFYRDLGWVEVP